MIDFILSLPTWAGCGLLKSDNGVRQIPLRDHSGA